MKATRRKAKPGEVIFFFGKLPGDNPDFIGMWGGDGATKRHSNAVMHGFTGERLGVLPGNAGKIEWSKSFIKELDEAGFDTSTIEFRIKVKDRDKVE